MSPVALKAALAGVLALVLGVAGGVWKVQGWRYGQKLAEQSAAYQADLTTISNAASDQVRTDQAKRLALEQRLAASDQTHQEVLTNAQKDQARLRDRLATADLRLSVLIDADSASGCDLPQATATGGVDHATVRARLDPAHAQRIIAITDTGDRGLIALQACQAYVRALSSADTAHP
ncbi:lysis system i-spanin subunit Rz [Pseudomonas iridis]|uniref:lysis system i-spanin subunit Rz n=1 Tax=Pseudomonas TaxID=286 RepID=UPI0006925C78|nr:lysis protein [Pseudomonas iridis]